MKIDKEVENLTETTLKTETSYFFLGGKEIIKENLNKTLNEDGEDSGMAGGGGLGLDNASFATVSDQNAQSMAMYGGSGDIHGNELYNIFLQPFLDIILTGVHGVSKLTQWAKSFLSVLIHGAVSTVIPFINADYSDIWEKYNKRMDGVDKKYQDVLKRNEEAMKMTDVWGIFFLMDPTTFLGLNLLSSGTTGIKSMLDLFFGGMPTAAWNKLSTTSQSIVDRINQLSDPTSYVRTRRSIDIFKEEIEQTSTPSAPLTKKELENPTFKKEMGKLLATSPQFIELQNQAANNILIPLKNILLSKTLFELNQNMAGKLSDTVSKFEQDKKSTPEEKQIIENGLLDSVKQKAVEEFKVQVKKHSSKNKQFANLLMQKIDSELVPLINKN